MTDWSQQMAEKLRKRSESQTVQDAKSAQSQKMKAEFGPHLWDAVKSDLFAHGKALNADMGKEIITKDDTNSTNEFVLVANIGDGIRKCRVSFDVELGKLEYATERGAKDSFQVWRGEDGKVSFYGSTVPYSSGSLAKQILNSLLD